MTFHPDDPSTWPCFKPLIIAHDVGRSRDRSTAVVGGNCPVAPRLIGIGELAELPQGLCGTPRANALAAIDRRYQSNALIVADLSNDSTYAEVLVDTFGRRVIGVHITRSGDGMNVEYRPVKGGVILVYNIGRSYLLDLLHGELQANQVRLVPGPESQKAYEQLVSLETEFRETGVVYTCPAGLHDDLGISCAILVWAARHPHLERWVGIANQMRRPQRPRQHYDWKAFT